MMNRRLTQLREEKRKLEAELAESRQGSASAAEITERACRLLEHGKRVLEAGEPDELKELIRCFVHKVTLDSKKNRGVIHYYAPPDSLARNLCLQDRTIRRFGTTKATGKSTRQIA